MKNLYLTAVFTFFALFLTWAQSPEQFNYQAVIRNSEEIYSRTKVLGSSLTYVRQQLPAILYLVKPSQPQPMNTVWLIYRSAAEPQSPEL